MARPHIARDSAVLLASWATLLLLVVACDEQSGTPVTADTGGDDTASADTTALDTAVADTTSADTASPDTAPDDTSVQLPPGPWDVQARGHHRVGYRELHVSYVPDPDTGTEREIPISLWYPTVDASGEGVTYFDLVDAVDVFGGAEPAPVPDGQEGFPLMVFSHGSGGGPQQSWFWTEYLASHGWIVAAPGHVGNRYSDAGGAVITGPMFRLRPLDVRATIDFMLDQGAGGDPIGARVSPQRLALSGHSFGGYTVEAVAGATIQIDDTLTGCTFGTVPAGWCPEMVAHQDTYRAGFGDPRVDAVVLMAPALTPFLGDGASAIEAPVMLMTSDFDSTTPDHQDGNPTWAALDGADDLRVRLGYGGHYTFSNTCEVVPALAAGDGCGPTFTPTAEAHPVLDAYGLTFLRRAFELPTDASAEAILDPATSLHDDVVLVAP